MGFGMQADSCASWSRAAGRLRARPRLPASSGRVRMRAWQGLLKCYKGDAPDMIAVDMGAPRLLWSEVRLLWSARAR